MTWQIVHTNGWLYAIDGWKPYVKWHYDIKSSGNTSVAGVTAGNNGIVYVATVTGRLYTFDTDTGELLWQVIVGPLTNRTCFPKLDDTGQVILGSLDGYLYVISSNGQSVKRYLGDWAENAIIHSSPYVDCAKKEIFVAQVTVDMKMTTTSVVTYLAAKGITFFMLDSNSGYVLFSEYSPAESLANEEGMLDTSLFLSMFASNHSIGGICNAFGAYVEGQKCILLSNDALEGAPAYIGRGIQPLYITLPLIFFVLGIMILGWFLLRKRYESIYGQLAQPEVFDRHIFPDFQDLCHKRVVFEDKVLKLELLLKNNPESKHLQMELCKAVEDLYTNEWVLSHFSVHYRSNTDAEPLLRESALSSSNMEIWGANTCSDIEQMDIVDPFAHFAIPNEYAILEAKKNGYSQSSFSTSMKRVETLYPNRASLKRSSANPLFRASQGVCGFISPESQIITHDDSDLENANGPGWSSTEMILDEQHLQEPGDLRHGNDDDMVVHTHEGMEIAENYWSHDDGVAYATQSVSLAENDNDINTNQDNGSGRFEDISQSLMGDGFEDVSQLPIADGIELTAPRSHCQSLTCGLRESLGKIEPYSKAGADENFVQGNVDCIADSSALNGEDENLSLNLTWVPDLQSGVQTTAGDEAIETAGMPLLNIEFYELDQGATQQQHAYPFDSEGMFSNEEEPSLQMLTSTDADSQSNKDSEASIDRGISGPSSPYLPSISEDPEAEEQEAKVYKGEEILQQEYERTPRQSAVIVGGNEMQPYVLDTEESAHATLEERANHCEGGDNYVGEDDFLKGFQGEVSGEAQEPLLDEQHWGSSSPPRLSHANDDKPFSRETINLSSFHTGDKSRHDRNQDSIENSQEVAREARKSVLRYSTDKSRALYDEPDHCLVSDTKSSGNSSDASTNTSGSLRSESSNQSTPRSAATTSVSEHAESFNSKGSTTTDVSDSDSNDDSDKSEVEGPDTDISSSSGPPRDGGTSNEHNLIAHSPGRESLILQDSALHRSHSSSERLERTRSLQYSIPRLPISEMRSFGSGRFDSEDGVLFQGPFMVSRYIPRPLRRRASAPVQASVPTRDMQERGNESSQRESL